MSSDTATQAIPQYQKAWRVVRRGIPSKALEFQTNFPVPRDLQPGNVLIKVHAAALNPVGYKLMGLAPNWAMNRPLTAEHDLSGVVVDQNGTEFKVGDEVCGWIPVGLQRENHQGALSQYVFVPASHLIKKPKNISHREAAGMILVGLTAYGALVNAAKLTASDKKSDDSLASSKTVFINGGGTSVGQMGIMIAKALGAKKVVASCSTRNVELLKQLGADEVFDYTKQPVYKQLISAAHNGAPKYDILFDAYGEPSPSFYTQSAKYLTSNGIFVTVGAPLKITDFLGFLYTGLLGTFCPSWLCGVQAKWKFYDVKNDRNGLEMMMKGVEEGKIRLKVDSHYKFEDALKAYDRIMTNKAVGKVVVDVVDSTDEA